MTDTCLICQTPLNVLDCDPDGRKDSTCARCRAEEEHDFDAEPFAIFSRSGELMRHASNYVAKHAKFLRGKYSVVLPNGRTVRSRDTYDLMQKVAREALRRPAQP